MHVPFPKLPRNWANDMGSWLDKTMPNPPLSEPQRWTITYSNEGKIGIRFANDNDATLFLLKWSL